MTNYLRYDYPGEYYRENILKKQMDKIRMSDKEGDL
jgi:hypothetical protein